MPQTPLSTSTPYCDVGDLFDYHDSNQCADMLRQGGDPRPSLMDMLSPTTLMGVRLTRFLLAGSGKIESVCLIGKRYTPADLQALTGGSQELLIKLNADLSFYMLCQRRQPGMSDPKSIPGALEALELLKELRDGGNIFGFVETAEAGLPLVQQAAPPSLLTPNVLRKAVRLFPSYYPNSLNGNQG